MGFMPTAWYTRPKYIYLYSPKRKLELNWDVFLKPWQYILQNALAHSCLCYRILQNIAFRGKMITFSSPAHLYFPILWAVVHIVNGLFVLFVLHTWIKFKTQTKTNIKHKQPKHYSVSIIPGISSDTTDTPRPNDGFWLPFPSQPLKYFV